MPVQFFKPLLILLFFIIQIRLWGQPSPGYTFGVGAKVHKGFIIKHTPKIGHLVQSHPEGFSLFMHKNTYGEKGWERLFNYPDIGISLRHINFNNPTLGKSWAFLTYLEVPFSPPHQRSSGFSFRFGPGIAYHTNPHHQDNNNTNVALGSHFSYALEAGLTYYFNIFQNTRINLEASINHFSNGAITKPNMGINVPAVNVGVYQKLSQFTPNYDFSEMGTQELTQYTYYLGLSTGIREVGEVGGETFPFYNLSLYGGRKTSSLTRLELGLDAFYDNSLNYRLKDKNKRNLNTFFRVGMVVGNELVVDKLSLVTQLGIYLYRNHKAYKPIYQRYGLRYALTHHLAASLSLKSHYGRAEYVEFGLGLRL